MGDRANCTLTLEGILLEEHLPQLARAIFMQGCESTEPEDCLREGTGSFEFQGVNYAQLDDDLRIALEAARLSYRWSWEPGDEYQAGVEIWNALSGEYAEFHLRKGSITMTLDEITEESLAKARIWDSFCRRPNLLHIPSSHAFIAARSAGLVPEGYFALHANDPERSAP